MHRWAGSPESARGMEQFNQGRFKPQRVQSDRTRDRTAPAQGASVRLDDARSRAGFAERLRGVLRTGSPTVKTMVRCPHDDAARFRHFAEIGADILFEMGPDLRFTWVQVPNGNLQKPPSEILGRTRWEVLELDPASIPELRAHQADQEAGRPDRNVDLKATYPERGTRTWRRVSADPLMDDATSPDAAVSCEMSPPNAKRTSCATTSTRGSMHSPMQAPKFSSNWMQSSGSPR